MSKDLIFEDLDRDTFDHKNESEYQKKFAKGLSEEVVRAISADKNEPEWMLEFRLTSLRKFLEMPMPSWGPDLSALDLDSITYFAKSDAKANSKSWDEVPDDIKKTFERLGIPEAERKVLAGVGAQYESEVVYHSLKKEWEEKGVIFEDCDVALKKYPELFKKYFMQCVPYTDHKFAALHGAVWSGGTFLYVPKGVKLDMPLQAYFRMNAPNQGQFEHTLIIVEDDAEAHYIEGCFMAGTKVSLLGGKKNIEEVEVNDVVLTHQGGFQSVYDVSTHKYSGDLYEIAYYGNSTEVVKATQEHPLLVVKRELANERNKKWNVEWIPASKIEKGDYLAIPVNKVVLDDEVHKFKIKKYNPSDKKFSEAEVKVPASPEFYKLVGYYLAEGSICGGSYLNFSFNKNELDLVQEVESLVFKVFGRECSRSYHHKNNGVNVVVSSVEVCRIFEYFGKKASEKSLPVFMQLGKFENQIEIIKSVFKGDGNYYLKKHKSGLKETFRINTISVSLAEQLQQILFRLGIFAFLNCSKRKSPRKPIYTVGVAGEYLEKFGKIVGISTVPVLNDKKRATKFFLNKDYAFVPVKSVNSSVVEDLPVYNLAVNEAETFVAAGVVVHNCSAPKYGSNALHAGCVEIYVGKRSKARYSSVENWSKDTYNLNTKRSIVDEDAVMEWVGGNMGCLTESANIFTCEGKVKSIKELQVNDKILSMNLEAKTFEEDRVVNKVLSGKKDVFELTVAGRKICASKNHPFLRVERRKLSKNHKKAFFETNWTNLEDLKVGDLIAIAKKVELVGVAFKLPKFKYDKMVSSNNQYSQFTSSIKHLYKPIKFPSYSTQDFMWFLGLWVGDGNIWFDKKSGGAKINIAIPKSSDIREKLLEVIKNLFDCPVNVSADRYVVINSVPLASLLKELGFGQIDFQKEIPEWVYTLPHDQKMSFIAGYFDADGHCGANGLYFTSVSYKLLNDLQLLAIQCGFGTSKIFKHRDAGPVEILGVMCNSKNTYRLILNGSMVYELTTKSMRYKKLISQIKTKRNYSTANGLNFKSKTSDYLGFAKIDNIQFIGTEETYDIEVEKNPNFIANGIVVHNSGVTMLYPATILKGRGAHADHLGVAFANAGQIQDTGAKVIHAAPDTSCNVVMKSLSKGGGVAMYRGLLQVNPNAYNVTARVECDALILDDYSRSDTVPDMKIMNNDVTIAHEASAGKLNEEDIFYLTSRGIDEETAKGMIVNGFIEPIVRELPLEYAVELNRLIELEMEGSVG